MKFNPDRNTDRIRKWLARGAKNARTRALTAFLKTEKLEPHGIAHLLSGQDLKAARAKVIKTLKIK